MGTVFLLALLLGTRLAKRQKEVPLGEKYGRKLSAITFSLAHAVFFSMSFGLLLLLKEACRAFYDKLLSSRAHTTRQTVHKRGTQREGVPAAQLTIVVLELNEASGE